MGWVAGCAGARVELSEEFRLLLVHACDESFRDPVRGGVAELREPFAEVFGHGDGDRQ